MLFLPTTALYGPSQLFPRCKEAPGAGAAAPAAGSAKKAVTKKKVKKKKKAANAAAAAGKAASSAEVRVANIIDLSAPAPEPIVAPHVAVASFHARPSAKLAAAAAGDTAGSASIIDLNDPGQCSGFVPPPLQPITTQRQAPPPPSVSEVAAVEASAAAEASSTSTSPSPTTPPSSVSVSPPTDEASGKAVQRRKQPQQQTVTHGAQIRETKIEIAGEKRREFGRNGLTACNGAGSRTTRKISC